jgi:hypothetical protein
VIAGGNEGIMGAVQRALGARTALRLLSDCRRSSA